MRRILLSKFLEDIRMVRLSSRRIKQMQKLLLRELQGVILKMLEFGGIINDSPLYHFKIVNI